ncbi:OmpA family protein [bacterium]|nr:OmpA family protein [bacterium]
MDDEKQIEEEEDDAPSSPAWMTTYGDMMTLLMTFFILIMSFSTMEVEKFKMAMGSLQGALGVMGMQKQLRPEQSWFSPIQFSLQNMKAESILEHVQNLRELIKKHDLEDQISIQHDKSETLILIKDQVLFDLGEAEIKPGFLKMLSTIAKSLLSKAKEIKIEGHTDDLPIRTDKYPSNWESSFDRALSVLKYFVQEEGMPADKLSAAGFGEQRPVVPNNSPENRAKNRRVVLNVRW